MAEDTLDVECHMDFHPLDVPHGIKDYVLTDLTHQQQMKLNQLKIQKSRENQQYLADHPEIRAIISIILRLLMRERPKRNVHKVLGNYFVRPLADIRQEVQDFIHNRTDLFHAIKVKPPLITKKPPPMESSETIAREIVTETVERVLSICEKLQIEKDYQCDLRFAQRLSNESMCNEIVKELIGDMLKQIEDEPEDCDEDVSLQFIKQLIS